MDVEGDQLQRLSSKKSSDHKPPRLILSCQMCRKKKIKCDRLRPCQGCVAAGRPLECQYDANEETQIYILQGEEIKRLRRRIRRLEQVQAQGTSRNEQELDEDVSFSSAAAQKSSTRQDIYRFERYPPPISKSPISSIVSPRVLNAEYVDRFINQHAPATELGQRSWLRTVVNETCRPSSSLFLSISAISMAFCAQQDADDSLKSRAESMYARVLSALNTELRTRDKAILATEALHSVITLSLFELIIKQDYQSWIIHLAGANRLIRHCGPDMFSTGAAHDAFRLYRTFNLSSSIIQRHTCFLSTPEWKRSPWARGYPGKDLRDLVLDIMVDIPGVLEVADSQAITSEALLQKFTLLDLELDEWRRRWALTYPGMQDFNGFVEGISIPTIDSTLSQSACLFFSAKLTLNRELLKHGAFTHQCEHESIEMIDEICTHIEYQLGQADDYIQRIGTLLPLQTAFHHPCLNAASRARLAKIFTTLFVKYNIRFGSFGPIGLRQMTIRATSPNPSMPFE